MFNYGLYVLEYTPKPHINIVRCMITKLSEGHCSRTEGDLIAPKDDRQVR